MPHRQIEEEPAYREATGGVTFAVDFNPAADRLRVLTNT